MMTSTNWNHYFEPTCTCGGTSMFNRRMDGRLWFPSLVPLSDTLDWIDHLKLNEVCESHTMYHHNSFNTRNNFNMNESDPEMSPAQCNSDCSSSQYQLRGERFHSEVVSWSVSHKIEQEMLEMTINPIELNFLPKELWLTPQVTVRSVFQNFFKARSTKNLRFEHKLWNALALAKKYPKLIPLLGVFWVSKDLIKVNRDIFGSLINVTKPAAALFNNQGSFLTHGFLEVTKEEALDLSGLSLEVVEDVDESIVRLFKHSAGLLTADSQKSDVAMCRWSK